MSKRTLVAVFEHEADLLRAVVAVRAADLRIGDVHTPYAVHGLDRALGWRPSRLSWACAFSGLAGAIFMLWFQWWTSAVSWPLNVGGKPWNSLPAFVPIIFEGMVLAAGLGTVCAMLVVARYRRDQLASWARYKVVATLLASGHKVLSAGHALYRRHLVTRRLAGWTLQLANRLVRRASRLAGRPRIDISCPKDRSVNHAPR